MAVANYESSEKRFPPAFKRGPDGRPWHSWRVLILPYIEGDALYKQYRFDEPWDGPNNRALADRMPKVFAFHGTEFPTTTTNYLAVVGPETMWLGNHGRTLSEITADRGSVVLIAENLGLGVHWMEPRDLDAATMSYAFNDPHGVSSWYKRPSIVTADGTVRTLDADTDPDSLRAMMRVTHDAKPADPPGQPLPDGRLRERAAPGTTPAKR